MTTVQNSRTLISIVVPVYNAARTVEPLVHSLAEELGGSYELDMILVDDNSSDSTEQKCLELQTKYPENITCLRLSRNFGEHNAVMAGLNYARGEYAVTMDDDLQNPPEEVVRLLAEIQKGYDIVYARSAERRYHWLRRVTSRLHGWLARRFLNKPDTIDLSTFRVMSRFLYQEVIKYGGSMPYIDAIVLRLTGSISSAAVRHDARRSGKSNYTYAKLIVLWGNAIISYSLIPLRAIGLLGLVFIVLGSMHGGIVIFDMVVPSRTDPSGYDQLSAVIIFLRGLTLTAIAIVGEYVGRIYLHLNRDPQFVVRRIRPARVVEKQRSNITQVSP